MYEYMGSLWKYQNKKFNKIQRIQVSGVGWGGTQKQIYKISFSRDHNIQNGFIVHEKQLSTEKKTKKQIDERMKDKKKR